MPTFLPGETRTARANLTNPTVKEFTYEVELYLDVTKVATSGPSFVTIGAGQTKEVPFTVTMPMEEGVYEVYLSVKVEGQLVVLYKAVEDVTIHVEPDVEVGPITWD